MRHTSRATLNDNNRYNYLRDDDSGDETTGDTAPRAPKKPPPIVISGLKMDDVKGIVKFLIDSKKVKENAEYKLSGANVHVYAKSVSDHEEIITYCKSKSLQFNSHQLADERKIKICLYGLTDMKTEDIKNELINNYKITPIDVKQLKPKDKTDANSQRQTESRIYLLYFRKGDGIKIDKLRQITGLFHIRVRWDYYTPRRQFLTQCSRCQQFGHGAENCYRTFKCVSCGDAHDSKTCTKRKAPVGVENAKPKVPDNEVVCANCSGKHTASFRGCPIRKEYLEKLQKNRSHQRQRNTKQFVYNDRDFAPLPPAPIPTSNPWYENRRIQSHSQPVSSNRENDTLMEMMKMQQQFQQQMFNTMTELISQITAKMEQMTQLVLSAIRPQPTPMNHDE